MSCSCKRKEMPVDFCKPSDNCICSFPTLIILILIILQFSKRDKKKDRCYEEDHGYYYKNKRHDDYDEKDDKYNRYDKYDKYDKDDKDDCDKDYDKDCHEDKQVDRGILFIIALFFLACAGCGKGFRSSCGC